MVDLCSTKIGDGWDRSLIWLFRDHAQGDQFGRQNAGLWEQEPTLETQSLVAPTLEKEDRGFESRSRLTEITNNLETVCLAAT
jgi:hypothetical protein